MAAPLKKISTNKPVSQSKKASDKQVKNSAGGFTFKSDDWDRLRRFLVLGTESGTFYASEKKHTERNFNVLARCVAKDGIRTVNEAVEISLAGRAPKNDYALFALAYAISHGDEKTRIAAGNALNKVARTGTHLFQFIAYAQQFRGWGKKLQWSVANWYNQDINKVAHNVVKYRNREGWTHKDAIRQAHPKPVSNLHDALFAWVTTDGERWDPEAAPKILFDFERLQAAKNPKESAKIIAETGLPRECVIQEHLTDPAVWEVLLDNQGKGMPLTALVRNLATMTRLGILTSQSDGTKTVLRQLGNEEVISKSRIHPINVLIALKTYAGGVGIRGSNTWIPVPKIIDALDEAFYTAFGNVESTGKRILIGLDVSGSMWQPVNGVPGMMASEASAAMCMVTARSEPDYEICGFASTFKPLNITPRQRLDDVMNIMQRETFGSTNCAAPMQYAKKKNLKFDAFIVYTDNETWSGGIHPHQALNEYRKSSGIKNAKLITAAMVANRYTIADPDDLNMLDTVGLDAALPNIIADFIRGND